MSADWDTTVAIISDLHCDHDETNPSSWLQVAARRVPPGNHPVQALIDLIRNEQISVDALICPGDLAHQASSPGMVQSYAHLLEIQTQLGTELLLTTIGNHDVDSRKKHGHDPFHIPKTIHPDFPSNDETHKRDFWNRGFYLTTPSEATAYLVLNTVIGHNDEAEAQRGTFGSLQIDELQRMLDSTDLSSYKHKIVVMHHHPLIHSQSGYGDSDVLEFGDRLLKTTSKHGFRLIIHGHKHEPRITRRTEGLGDSLVFAAGSFAAKLQDLSTWTRNLFHILKLRKNEDQRVTGQILSWEFYKGVGWRPATSTSAAFPHSVNFCLPRPEVNIETVVSKCSQTSSVFWENDVLSIFPDLSLLLPDELQHLQMELQKHRIKLKISDDGTIEYLGKL